MNDFMCPRCKAYTVSTTEIGGNLFAACSQCDWTARIQDFDKQSNVAAKGMTKGCLWIILAFFVLVVIANAIPRIVRGFHEAIPTQEAK